MYFAFAGGPIEALKDVWILGDAFIVQIFHQLQKMKSKAKAAK